MVIDITPFPNVWTIVLYILVIIRSIYLGCRKFLNGNCFNLRKQRQKPQSSTSTTPCDRVVESSREGVMWRLNHCCHYFMTFNLVSLHYILLILLIEIFIIVRLS